VPQHDVAIYMPYANGYYDATIRRCGGAERQTVLLARSLVEQGMRVAHIVSPLRRPDHLPHGPTLVERAGERYKPLGRAVDPVNIWRAMAEADARIYIFRGASGVLGPGAAFCRARGRKLVFSGANNADFKIPPMGMEGVRAAMYLRGVQTAARIVVQSHDQIGLAGNVFPGIAVHEIPSFVEAGPVARTAGKHFLWAGRLVDYKRPGMVLDLAKALPEAQFTMVGTVSVGETDDAHVDELHRTADALPNVQLHSALPHTALMELVEESVAVLNTSLTEGMPNVWLEGWARGVPALSLEFDPDGRVARNGLGIVAGGDFEAFVAGARSLWERRDDHAGFGDVVRRYVTDTHGAAAVGARWSELLRGV
jgi:glycosyltransferase involved in cell wall biosynthesis